MNRVIQRIASDLKCPAAALTRETTLDELAVDSFRFVHIMLGIEDYFMVRVPEGEIARLETIGDIAETVEGLINELS